MANQDDSIPAHITDVAPYEQPYQNDEEFSVVEYDKPELVEAVQRVQAPYVVARRFPRSEERALSRILNECRRLGLASAAMYAVPRGGKTQRGPSIRLAESLARNWGNIGFGQRELEHVDGINGFTRVEAFCVDFETNAQESKTFTVYHKRKANKQIKHIEDPQEIAELVLNYGSRRMRNCILAVIPKHIVEEAVKQVETTLRLQGKDTPIQDRVNQLVKAFEQFNVNIDLIEKRLGHELKHISEEELIDLRAIYVSLKEGQTKRGEWFDPRADADPEIGRAAKLNATKKVPDGKA